MESQESKQSGQKQRILTKKRYEEMIDMFRRICTNETMASDMTVEFERIMDYDPNKKQYTPELGKKIMESRKKRIQELGTTMWEYNGGKRAYERKKTTASSVQS